MNHTITWTNTADDILSAHANCTYTVKLKPESTDLALISITINGREGPDSDKTFRTEIVFRSDVADTICKSIAYLADLYRSRNQK